PTIEMVGYDGNKPACAGSPIREGGFCSTIAPDFNRGKQKLDNPPLKWGAMTETNLPAQVPQSAKADFVPPVPPISIEGRMRES
ncbi:MAG: hypothetical protein N2651_06880, partial [Fimbriimonadales bacterium]|nr:hypothetical protein [Fimbriimonadales bacterium]